MGKEITVSTFSDLLKMLFKENKVVLDIGSNAIKALNVVSKGKQLMVHNFLEIENVEKYFNGKDLSNYEGVAQDLSRVLKITDVKAKKVDVVYNSTNLQAKIIKVPDMNEKDLKEFVEIEYHKSFANISPHTHIMDYLPMGLIQEEDRTQNSILIASLPIVESAKLLKSFETKGIEVNAIETNIHALGNALNLVEPNAEDKMILHIGKEYSLVLFSKGNVPTFYRMFNFGYSPLIRNMQTELSTSLVNIDNAVKNLGFYEDEDYKTDFSQDSYQYALKDSLNNFMTEVYRSINYVKSIGKFEAETLYLSGGMANMKGIEEFVEESIVMDTKTWRLDKYEHNGYTIKVKGSETLGPEFALAMGLSVRGWM